LHNHHTPEIATTRHRNLVKRGGRKAFVRDKGFAHTHNREKKREKRKRNVRKKRYSRI